MHHLLFGAARGVGVALVVLALTLTLRLYRLEIDHGFRNEHRPAYVYYAIIMAIGFALVSGLS